MNLRPAYCTLCGLLFFAALSLPADEPKNAADGAKEAGSGGLLRKLREGVTKALDKDGDGKVSEDEKNAIKDGLQKKLLERYDTNKDGKLSDEEKQAVKEEIGKVGKLAGGDADKKEMLKKFDKNRDGKLDDAERKAAGKAKKKNPQDGEKTAEEKPKGEGTVKPLPSPESEPPAVKGEPSLNAGKEK